MKVLVWDDGFLGNSEDGNIVRELHSISPDGCSVKMEDGQIFSYQNAISIELLKCPKCLQNIEEKALGRSEFVSNGYSGACLSCEEDFYLAEMVNN